MTQDNLHVTFLRILRALRIGRVLRRVKVLGLICAEYFIDESDVFEKTIGDLRLALI